MAIPTLTPASQVSAVILPRTGSASDVSLQTPIGVYDASTDFLSGAADQINYTYQKLGGDVLDIELTTGSVYAAYEEAVLEYSYIVNMHQSKNILSDILGMTTGTFDHDGELKEGELSSSLSGTHIALKYPKVTFALNQKYGDAVSTQVGIGGLTTIYSGSFAPIQDVQDYDLGAIILSASNNNLDKATGDPVPYSGLVSGKRVIVDKVYYKTPAAMWRFYGYYGGLNTVGNLANYGQYADDSTFEIVPAWQNKLQAIMYEDSLYTRVSHYSYEIINNRLRLYPKPRGEDNFAGYLDRVWFRFRIADNSWGEGDSTDTGVLGVNNINTLPFDNIPYENINSMGKQWIRNYALALCKEMLGQIRGKFQTVPIPGESVTLNYSSLLSEAQKEKDDLRQGLTEMLKEIEYPELAKKDQEKVTAAEETLRRSPLPIFVG